MKRLFPLFLLLLFPWKPEAQNIYGFAGRYFVSFNPYTDAADTLIEFEGNPYINLEFRSAIDRYNGRYFFGGSIPGLEGKFHIIDLNTLEITSYPVYPENIEYDFMHNKLVYEKHGSFYSLDLYTMTATNLGGIEDGDGYIFGQIRTYIPQRNEYVYIDYPTGKPGLHSRVIDAASGDIKCEEIIGYVDGKFFSPSGMIANDLTGEIMCHYNETFAFFDPCEPYIHKLSDIAGYGSALNTQLCVYDHFLKYYIVPFADDHDPFQNKYAIISPYDNEVIAIKEHPFNRSMNQQRMYDKPLAPLIDLHDTLFVPVGKHYTWFRDGIRIGETLGRENYWVPTLSGLYIAEVEFRAYTTMSTAVEITITGIKKEPDNHALYLYPNPAVDDVYIQLESADIERVVILDMTGHVVYSRDVDGSVNGPISINIQGLPAGVYTINVLVGGKIKVGKFVKV